MAPLLPLTACPHTGPAAGQHFCQVQPANASVSAAEDVAQHHLLSLG